MRALALLVVFAAIANATPNDYTKPESWLCRPGRPGDACSVDESTTIVAADGSTTLEPWKADPNAPVDCFYVYPTVSRETTPNSDMTPGPGEIGVAAQQAARFASKCRVYAPIYRSMTNVGLRAMLTGTGAQPDEQIAFGDVRDAWRAYLAHDNHGRGVVLIGHSQGSMMLDQLLRDEIDGKPAQKLLVSALLAGTSFQVPIGKDVGGDLKSIPLCRSTTQTGCVVSFVSFRKGSPPTPRSKFGKGKQPGMQAACVNPASPSGGSAPLHSYFRAQPSAFARTATPVWTTQASVTTPFVTLPGLVSAECVTDEHGTYLALSVHGDPNDPRTDDIPGDFVEGGNVMPGWGMHLVDMHLTMGDLLALVGSQGKAWLATHH